MTTETATEDRVVLVLDQSDGASLVEIADLPAYSPRDARAWLAPRGDVERYIALEQEYNAIGERFRVLRREVTRTENRLIPVNYVKWELPPTDTK
jgi:hypothetical protein